MTDPTKIALIGLLEAVYRTVKKILLGTTIFALPLLAMASTPNAGGEWRQKLSTKVYKIGMSRAEVEKQLGAKVLIEFAHDHGFALLRDVYYELDASWAVVISYRPADKMSDYPYAERPAMKLIVQPQLLPIRLGLIEELRQNATSAKPISK